jgi:hypothetical protein
MGRARCRTLCVVAPPRLNRGRICVFQSELVPARAPLFSWAAQGAKNKESDGLIRKRPGGSQVWARTTDRCISQEGGGPSQSPPLPFARPANPRCLPGGTASGCGWRRGHAAMFPRTYPRLPFIPRGPADERAPRSRAVQCGTWAGVSASPHCCFMILEFQAAFVHPPSRWPVISSIL